MSLLIEERVYILAEAREFREIQTIRNRRVHIKHMDMEFSRGRVALRHLQVVGIGAGEMA